VRGTQVRKIIEASDLASEAWSSLIGQQLIKTYFYENKSRALSLLPQYSSFAEASSLQFPPAILRWFQLEVVEEWRKKRFPQAVARELYLEKIRMFMIATGQDPNGGSLQFPNLEKLAKVLADVNQRVRARFPFLKQELSLSDWQSVELSNFLLLVSSYEHRGFSQERLTWIIESESKLPRERSLYVEVLNGHGWLQEHVRMFEGNALIELPWERHTNVVAPQRAGAAPCTGFVELGRALSIAIEGNVDDSFGAVAEQISTYLDRKYLSKGCEVYVYIHTDDTVGRQIFSKLIDVENELRSADLKKAGECVLVIRGSTFANRYPSHHPFMKFLLKNPDIASQEAFHRNKAEQELQRHRQGMPGVLSAIGFGF